MGLAGSIIGGVIGGIFGGPWGAAIGAGLGAMAGSGDQQKKPEAPSGPDGLECWFLSLGKLAKADGIVTQNEADFISELLRSLELPGEARKKLILAFNSGKTDPRSFAQCVRAAASFFPDRKRRLSLMQTYCVLAIADGVPDAAAKRLLKSAETVLDLSGYTDSFLEDHFQPRTEGNDPSSSSGLAEAYQLLGLSPDSPDAALKQAWRKKVLEYHPDRIQGKGLPESFIRFAADQTRKINEAYDRICASRGIKKQ